MNRKLDSINKKLLQSVDELSVFKEAIEKTGDNDLIALLKESKGHTSNIREATSAIDKLTSRP
jgi:hypothetical protein